MITDSDVKKNYDFYIQLCKKNIEKENYFNALKCAEIACKISYMVNYNYSDLKLEHMIKQIGEKLICAENYNTTSEKYVFYDGVATDNIVLTQHYINALISWDVDFLYIAEEKGNPDRYKDILSQLNKCPKAHIYIIKGKQYNKNVLNNLIKTIIEFKPEKAFIQIYAFDVYAAMIWSALTNTERFLIMNGDHLFTVGVNCVDYILEFRNYGYNISHKYRGIDKNRLLIQPFYTAVNHHKFEGLPKEADGKIKLLTGGACFKIYGNDDIFFLNMKNILHKHEDAIILYLGDGNLNHLKHLIKENCLEKRFIPIGYRKDIFEVMYHCDIFIDTFPCDGGLMLQIAAYCAKPILIIKDKTMPLSDSHEIINDKSEPYIVFNDFDKYHRAVSELIKSDALRMKQGCLVKKLLYTPEQFNRNLYTLIHKKENLETLKDMDIDIKEIHKYFMEIENKYLQRYRRVNINRVMLKKHPIWFGYNFILALVQYCCQYLDKYI